ncbi:MAG TPA: vWA domain-containing protein [Polyangiales bacterium]|nr:vWA domain-containing protein [Polyangiales bacterium]
MDTIANNRAHVGRAGEAWCLVWVGIVLTAGLGCSAEDGEPRGRAPGPGAAASGSTTAGSGSGNGTAGDNLFGNSEQGGSAGSRVQTMPLAGTGNMCVGGMADTSPVTPTVWLVVDGSSSMNMNFDASGNRWQVLRSTLMAPGGIVDSLQVVVKFGMVIYAGSEDENACVQLVTVQPALNNFATLDAMYPQTPLGNGTPTDKALENVVMNLPVLNQQQLDERADPIYVVLATDGAPNALCGNAGGGGFGMGASGGDPMVMQRVIDVVTSGTTMGMQMFVISLAGQDMALQTHLEQVAGATSSKLPPFVPATKADLINNFQSIVGGATCQVTLNGMVTAGKECSGTVKLNGMDLMCNSDNGWRLSDDHTVQLTGTACDTLLSMQSLVTASFPCGVFIVK